MDFLYHFGIKYSRTTIRQILISAGCCETGILILASGQLSVGVLDLVPSTAHPQDVLLGS